MKIQVMLLTGVLLVLVPLKGYTQNTVTIDPANEHQKMEGIGGALAFYENWLPNHPNKNEIYQLIYEDLGLDILRLRNRYEWEGQAAFEDKISYEIEYVQKADSLRGDNMKYLMCSWSPPDNLKQDGTGPQTGSEEQNTLDTQNGDYVYGEYARYWEESLIAYKQAGLTFNWISIQNEPDWSTGDWETCRFTPTETNTYAGYATAFDSVYNRIKDLAFAPVMLGPEPLGIGNNSTNFQYYTDPIQGKDGLGGYAYHLYNGGDPQYPDSYNDGFNVIRNNYSSLPNIMTEYELFDQPWINTAHLISNVFTEADASAFIYWDIVWPDNGLIDIENPWNVSDGQQGYSINTAYYNAVKHFSKHISSGYRRVGLSDENSNVKSSAFKAPSGDKLTVVLINTNSGNVTSEININGRTVTGSQVIQSTDGNFYVDEGSLGNNNEVSLPGNSVTTVIVELNPQAVGWGNFSATVTQEHPMVSWMGYSNNMNHYVIERKNDAGNWEKVDKVQANGSSLYKWTDYEKEASETHYYRIKGVNRKGKNKYSPVLSTADSDNGKLKVAPNPATGKNWSVRLNNSYRGEIELTVFDYQGKQFLQDSFRKTSASFFVSARQLDEMLSPGVYQVVVTTRDAVFKEKLVVTR